MYPVALTRVLREDINSWVGHVNRRRPAWRSPGDTAGFPGSPPGAAPPDPLGLVRLGPVGLWWLESGRRALTDAAYLLPHPGSVALGRLGRSEEPPAHLRFTFPNTERPGPNSLPQSPPRSSSSLTSV